MLKKNSFLYIDCDDIRLNIEILNEDLNNFIAKNKITYLLLDNYKKNILIPSCEQIILSSLTAFAIKNFTSIELTTLDYEEYMGFDPKFDNEHNLFGRYLKYGSLPEISNIQGNTELHIQNLLKSHLSEKELILFKTLASMNGQKVSVHQLYIKLKTTIKISKDKLYEMFYQLHQKHFFYLIQKYNQPKSAKKIYMFDFTLKNVLTYNKDFNTLFANLVLLELKRNYQKIYYLDNLDFYMPEANIIIIAQPFSSPQQIEKKLQKIIQFGTENYLKEIIILTMNQNNNLGHIYPNYKTLSFTQWVLGEE
jgi:predicted AAA+ superfamily ATPase